MVAREARPRGELDEQGPVRPAGAASAALAAGIVRTEFLTYLPAFFTAGALCVVAAILILGVPKPSAGRGTAAMPLPARGGATIDDKVRKHTLALELARIDELQEVFYARALEGDVQWGALCTKIIERRCTMLGPFARAA